MALTALKAGEDAGVEEAALGGTQEQGDVNDPFNRKPRLTMEEVLEVASMGREYTGARDKKAHAGLEGAGAGGTGLGGAGSGEKGARSRVDGHVPEREVRKDGTWSYARENHVRGDDEAVLGVGARDDTLRGLRRDGMDVHVPGFRNKYEGERPFLGAHQPQVLSGGDDASSFAQGMVFLSLAIFTYMVLICQGLGSRSVKSRGVLAR